MLGFPTLSVGFPKRLAHQLCIASLFICSFYPLKFLTAAKIIQRNARFFFGMKRWRRWKREKIMKVVRRYASYVQEKALKNILSRTLKKHSDNMRKPQAWVRGYLLRNIMKNARWVAYNMGKSRFIYILVVLLSLLVFSISKLAANFA